MFKNPVIVQNHRPWRWLLVLTIGLLAALATAWLAYQRGQVDAVGDLAGLQVGNAMLSQTLEQLMEKNAHLREQNALLERTAQIERQAYDEVDKTLTGLQAERLSLQEELAFYRGIVSDTKSEGLQIREFEITPHGQGYYHFRIVLTHNMKNGKVIGGKVEIVLTGSLGDDEIELGLDSLSSSGALALEIKHFQRLEGRLELPEGFIPDIASVVVTPNGKRAKKVEQSYPWPG